MRILPPPNTHIRIVAILSDITFIPLIIFWFHFSEKTKLEGGSSLLYPPEIVATIRQLYPGDIKDYPPQSRKVSKNLPLLQFLQNRFFSCSFLLSTCSVKCCMKSPWRSWWRCTTRKTSVIQ